MSDRPAPFSLGRLRDARRRARRVAASGARRIADRLSGRFTIELDYPPAAANEPRWGHGRPSHRVLEQIVAAHDDEYRASLATLLEYREALAAIPLEATSAGEPAWINDFLPGLDAAALYGFVRDRAPQRYLEVGSGHSTRFVARAIRDGLLATEIVSIDPHPRADVEQLCDIAVREPLESADLGVFEALRPGDVLFVDCSHRVFMNSDVVTFYLELLPSVPPGVLIGVHDVYLPDDYDPWERDDYYSEQYLLAMAMIADRSLLAPVLPAFYVSSRPELAEILEPLWEDPRLAGVPRFGVGFWFENRRDWGR